MDLRSHARRIVATFLLALSLGAAHAEGPEGVSARSLAAAIASSGWYAVEECPVSEIVERSAPGCARIPAPLDTAVQWLDLLDRAVFLEARAEGGWVERGAMRYATWHLATTGQRFLLVLSAHPHRPVTILYVSELAAATLTASSR
jgi:hypothetical protein